MRVEYNITDEQLLAAFAAGVSGPDDCVYVWLPQLALDKQPSPIRFPVGTTLEEAWRLIGKNVIARIRDGRMAEIVKYRPLDPSPPSSNDTIH